MARIYNVIDREITHPVPGGLMLPFPPTAGGRLMLRGGNQGLTYKPMAATAYAGRFPRDREEGIWTDSISDCVVIAIMEYSENTWKSFCFQHMLGGCFTHTIEDYQRGGRPVAGDCWAVIADKSGSTSTIEDQLYVWGVPRQQGRVSIYRSGGDFKFGLRFFGGYFGEI